MDTAGIEQMLGVLQKTAQEAKGIKPASAADSAGSEGTDFAQVLKGAIDKVNNTQQEATGMMENFAAGDTSKNLNEVITAMQTASISFQEMVQVRNRLITAYQDVMNMQV
jgi:flagellar hook-basal body complex protein FliE